MHLDIFRAGLLDTLSEEQLDLVDVMVFDVEASGRVRQEALAFLMDHTEGFDEDAIEGGNNGGGGGEDGDADLGSLSGMTILSPGRAKAKGTSKSKAKSSSGGASKADQSRALARRQRTAQQLETLTEFAEHHLGTSIEWSHMLAEACLGLRRYGERFKMV